jgi:DNA transformation protein and related proteins
MAKHSTRNPKTTKPVKKKVTARKKAATKRKRQFARMGVSDGFRDYLLDQLSSVPDLRAKSMFGGLGLYSGELFFGLIAADVFYLKVDDRTRPEFVRAGGTAFQPYAERASTNYFSVPPRILEDQTTLAHWARKALDTASAAKSKRR